MHGDSAPGASLLYPVSDHHSNSGCDDDDDDDDDGGFATLVSVECRAVSPTAAPVERRPFRLKVAHVGGTAAT